MRLIRMNAISSSSYSPQSLVEPRKANLWIRHPIIGGALGGLVWGILMRLWMRYISTDPEFSWSGTGFILGAALVAGLGLGTAYAFNRKGRAGWWRLFGLPVILLGAGAGSVMLPGVVIGGLAFARRNWPKNVRIALGVLAIGGTVVLLLLGRVVFGQIKTAVALTSFAVLHTIEMAATSLAMAPAKRI